MGSAILSIITAILGVEFIFGNMSNGFIILINITEWVRRRKITSVDQLLTALAISRICQLWTIFLNKLLSVLFPPVLWSKGVYKMSSITWISANHFSMWLATSLSIFYFLKIANFSNSAFLYLKWRVEKAISGTLLVSLVILLLNIAFSNTYIDSWADECRRNRTGNCSSQESLYLSRRFLLSYVIFIIVPFTVLLTAFLLLIFSLWRHLRKMQLRAVGSRDASTEAHLQGLHTVFAFLLFYAIFFLSLAMQVFIFRLQAKNVITMASYIFTMTFPACHSYILIVRTKKLRQAALSMLWSLKCSFKDKGCPFLSAT
ncbi:taste receptor type 2 member 125-like [Ochotona curzoniae]|uniref:taste receptor type 2 member 125-like n=1 Tax=Ochotona curzoniae TaxID=130825 RepID=UPI001B34E0DC|nr:taste receptor type 2 member 125-like [Ochotona curzoniae]